jgi:hypothetical protein
VDIRRVFSGLNVIAIGLILLANTLGYLPWSVWWNILSLWPLLLVAAGVDILGRAFGWSWMRAVSGLVILGGLVFGALVMPASGTVFPALWSLGQGRGVPFEQSIPRVPGTSLAVLEVSEGASDVTFGPSSPGILASIAGRSTQPVPRMTWVRRGAHTSIDVSRPSGGAPILGDSTLRVGMDRTTEWADLSISTGASSVKADLSEVAVDSLDLNTGATSVTTTLGVLANCRVSVSAGASSVTIAVPDRARVRVVSDGALVAADLPGFTRVSGWGFGETVWTYTPKDGPGANAITIDVSMGAGSLRVAPYSPEVVPPATRLNIEHTP